MFRSKAERKVQEAGYDPGRLPPGQYLTAKWPVLHAGSVPRYDELSTWTFRVFGDVAEVSGIVAFLAGDRASYITGASIDVAGGMGRYV